MIYTTNIFSSARIKLTAYYVLTILTISICFSAILYHGATNELRKSLRSQALRFVPRFDRMIPYSVVTEPDESVYQEAQQRIVYQLLILNSAIVLFSSIASYILAGKTLAPIEKMMEEQKRFISDASHELRTPLTAMRTEIEVMLREKTVKTEDAKKILESNLEEVDKMRALSDYLLKLSKYDTGSQTIPKEEMSIRSAADRARKNVTALATAKKIAISEEVSDLHLYANSISLTELLTILLDNAIKYSRDGDSVELRAFQQGKCVQIEVEDHGYGIRATEIPYIFNRFYRAESSRNKKHIDGFGLGLSIARSIVRQHHGKIWVESEVGKGSTFHISLPV